MSRLGYLRNGYKIPVGAGMTKKIAVMTV